MRKYTLQTYNLQPLTYQQLFPMLKIFLKNAIPVVVVVVLVGKISSLSCLLVTISFLTKKERMRVKENLRNLQCNVCLPVKKIFM